MCSSDLRSQTPIRIAVERPGIGMPTPGSHPNFFLRARIGRRIRVVTRWRQWIDLPVFGVPGRVLRSIGVEKKSPPSQIGKSLLHFCSTHIVVKNLFVDLRKRVTKTRREESLMQTSARHVHATDILQSVFEISPEIHLPFQISPLFFCPSLNFQRGLLA